MIRGFSRRGQPLAVLAMVLAGWVSARAMMWDAEAMPMVRQGATIPVAVVPMPVAARPDYVEDNGKAARAPRLAVAAAKDQPTGIVPKLVSRFGAATDKATGKVGEGLAYASQEVPGLVRSDSLPATRAVPPAYAPSPGTRPRLARASRSGAGPRPAASGVASQIIVQPQAVAAGWAQPAPAQTDARFMQASYTQSSYHKDSSYLPDPTAPVYTYSPGAFAASPPERPRARRWSMDAWYYWRRGSTTGISPGAFAPSYGASQAGGVLRYRLAPSSGHKPSIYVRSTAALDGSAEREVALGLLGRPLAKMPVVLAAEGRYTTTPDGKVFRPAGFAYTELPPFRLPLGLRGEVYAQGGYVGGKNATPFIDGQLRADRRLLKLNRPEVRLGGGLWGGAQKGAARLDAGPSIVVTAPIKGSLSARLAADWRFRLAGDAAPASGPAVTLSAGF